MQSSWWEGLVLAHWWVELGLNPLVDRVNDRLEAAEGSGRL